MAAITFSILQYWLNEELSGARPGRPAFCCKGEMRLYEPAFRPDPFVLYVGLPKDMQAFLKHVRLHAERGSAYCYLCCEQNTGSFPREALARNPASSPPDCGKDPRADPCAKKEPAAPDALPDNCSILYTGKSLAAIFNIMADRFSEFNRWNYRLRNVLYKNEGIQKLLDLSSFLPGTLILTNAGYKLQAAIYKENVSDPKIDEVRQLGYHTFETIELIHKESPLLSTPETTEYVSNLSNNYTIIRLLRYKDHVAARLCLILDGPSTDPAYSDYLEILGDAIARYLFNKQSADYANNAALGSLVADIIEGRLVDQNELAHRMKQVRLIAQRYFHLMIVSFGQEGRSGMIPWNYIISQLQYIFPYSNITAYEGDILLIIQKRQRKSRVHFNEKQLMALLEQYDGFSCMGNASEFMMSLPTMYHQIRAALRIGSHMEPGKRIYYYEEFAMYQIIELAAESEVKLLSSRNLVHLCNNEMIALIRYDQKYRTDMVDVLLTFLKYERNTTKTAEALFMHRNTLLYKIKKVEEIIDRDLDDPDFRARMLFSGYVLDYMRKYKNEDILLLQRENKKDK